MHADNSPPPVTVALRPKAAQTAAQSRGGTRYLFAFALIFAVAAAVVAAPDINKLLNLAQLRYGTGGVQKVQLWEDLLRSSQQLAESEKVGRVNEFFNRSIAYAEDPQIWGQNDYWATPLETMGRGIGDCEDFSIAKYFTLRLLGVPVDRMRLVYVRAQMGGPYSRISQAHMVLSYYPSPEAEPLILDNLISDLRPASRRPDLTPVFSFNSEGLWVGSVAPGGTSAGSATARLSRWRDVIARMQAEGFE